MTSFKQPLDRIVPDPVLQPKADVVVIGGGIAGITAAYYLAKKGLSVTVLEKGVVAAEQSSRNWGWVRCQGRDIHELELMKRSMELWREVQAGSGADPGFEQSGTLFVTDSKDQLDGWGRWQVAARRHDIRSKILSATELRRKLPGCSVGWLGGIFTAEDGRAEPAKAVPAFARLAQSLGVKIHEGCAARELVLSGRRIVGVATERGVVATNKVLCAGGAWSRIFCGHHGIPLPQAVVNASVAVTGAAPDVLHACLSTTTVSARHRVDGGYTVAMSGRGTVHITPSLLMQAWKFFPLFLVRRRGLKIRFGRPFFEELFQKGWDANTVSPFEMSRIADPAPDPELLGRALEDFRKMFPEFASLPSATQWGAGIDSMPDALPVIGKESSLDGLYLSTGYSGHGFGIGPGSGELIADLIAGDKPRVDPTPYRYERLVDGTRLRPQAGAY